MIKWDDLERWEQILVNIIMIFGLIVVILVIFFDYII
jgi:hypothetical protein